MSVATVNNKIQPLSTLSTERDYDAASVSERPVYLQQFGDYIASLRPAGWNQSDAARYARQRGIGGLSRNQILRLEKGKTKNVSPDLLRGIAALYDRDYREIVAHFAAARFGLTSAVTGADQGSRHTNTGGGTRDVSAPLERHRLSELEAELADLKAKWSEVQDVARHLFQVAVGGNEGGAAAGAPARRRRTARKAS